VQDTVQSLGHNGKTSVPLSLTHCVWCSQTQCEFKAPWWGVPNYQWFKVQT